MPPGAKIALKAQFMLEIHLKCRSAQNDQPLKAHPSCRLKNKRLNFRLLVLRIGSLYEVPPGGQADKLHLDDTTLDPKGGSLWRPLAKRHTRA